MLRLSFRSSKAAPEPPPPDVTPEVEFVAYAEDCVLSGRVRLEADRLSDLLNANREFELVDVLARDLAGGDPVRVHELQIARDEILVVHATGPRGRADRRHPTRQVPIIVKIGPYEVSGYVHVMPGADALASLRRGRSLVALSDAAIDYHVGQGGRASRGRDGAAQLGARRFRSSRSPTGRRSSRSMPPSRSPAS